MCLAAQACRRRPPELVTPGTRRPRAAAQAGRRRSASASARGSRLAARPSSAVPAACRAQLEGRRWRVHREEVAEAAASEGVRVRRVRGSRHGGSLHLLDPEPLSIEQEDS